ncbi:uncharacterized protein DEA37_0013584 [Paragonimus westermani]|uniref:Cysteine-rich DPF motif domain-containing protein 1 n=1 Tax=Paragonimus westermani TaxID=34504 RepID=A0A5J4NTI4_9TREM|nr:uncharacterized protein DEA37_0013584 [Paragonimus westermani]
MSNAEAQFCCNTCGFKINYDNKGRRPKYFNRDLELLEDAYTMRDPFADDNLGGIILGSDCCICKEMVCISQNCSLFYNKRYCRDCSVKHVDEFPLDLRQASGGLPCDRKSPSFIWPSGAKCDDLLAAFVTCCLLFIHSDKDCSEIHFTLWLFVS